MREFFNDNLLVPTHFFIVMIRWTGLAPWAFKFPLPGSRTSTFLVDVLAARPLPAQAQPISGLRTFSGTAVPWMPQAVMASPFKLGMSF